jgi:hypothetical protein
LNIRFRYIAVACCLLLAWIYAMLPYGIAVVLWHALRDTHRSAVHFADVTWDPWDGVVRIQDLQATTPDGVVLRCDRIEIRAEWHTLLFGHHVVLRNVLVQGGEVSVDIRPGTEDGDDVIVHVGGFRVPMPSEWAAWSRQSGRTIAVEQVQLRDFHAWLTAPGASAALRVERAGLIGLHSLPGVRTPEIMPEIKVDGALNGARVQMTGTLSGGSGQRRLVTVHLDTDAIPIASFANRVLPEVQEFDATLTLDTSLGAELTPEGTPVGWTQHGTIELGNVRIQTRAVRIDMPRLMWKGTLDASAARPGDPLKRVSMRGYLEGGGLDLDRMSQGERWHHAGLLLAANLTAQRNDERHDWVVRHASRLRVKQLRFRDAGTRVNQRTLAWGGQAGWRWPVEDRRTGAMSGALAVVRGHVQVTGLDAEVGSSLAAAESISLPVSLRAVEANDSQSLLHVDQMGPISLFWWRMSRNGIDVTDRSSRWSGRIHATVEPRENTGTVMSVDATGQLDGIHGRMKPEDGEWVTQHRGMSWNGQVAYRPAEGDTLAVTGKATLKELAVDFPQQKWNALSAEQVDMEYLHATGMRMVDVGMLRMQKARVGRHMVSGSTLLENGVVTLKRVRLTQQPRRLTFGSIQIQPPVTTVPSTRPEIRSAQHPVWKMLVSLGFDLPGMGLAAVRPAGSVVQGRKVDVPESAPVVGSSPRPVGRTPDATAAMPPAAKDAEPRFMVIMDSFREYRDLLVLARIQRQRGYDVWWTIKHDVQNQVWYTLAIGSYANREQANAAMRSGCSAANHSCYVMRLMPAADTGALPGFTRVEEDKTQQERRTAPPSPPVQTKPARRTA